MQTLTQEDNQHCHFKPTGKEIKRFILAGVSLFKGLTKVFHSGWLDLCSGMKPTQLCLTFKLHRIQTIYTVFILTLYLAFAVCNKYMYFIVLHSLQQKHTPVSPFQTPSSWELTLLYILLSWMLACIDHLPSIAKILLIEIKSGTWRGAPQLSVLFMCAFSWFINLRGVFAVNRN